MRHRAPDAVLHGHPPRDVGADLHGHPPRQVGAVLHEHPPRQVDAMRIGHPPREVDAVRHEHPPRQVGAVLHEHPPRQVGAVRIVGAYPPPLPRPAAVHVTRYDLRRQRGRAASRAWTALSASLATAGVAVLLLAPAAAPTTVRQEVAAEGPVRQEAPVSQVAAVPSAQVSAVPVPAATPAAPSPEPGPLLLAASEPVTVDIPVLRVSADIVDLGLRRDGSMQTPDGAAPVGWYTGSPTPGARGPAVLAGHVDWEGEAGSFYGLRELLPGDVVSVGRADGSSAVFVVDRVEEHAKDAFPTEEVYGDTPDGQLRLITCGGAFDDGAGEYLANVVVFATLIAVR